MPSGRSPNKLRSKVEDKDRDQKHRRRLQDALPLETPRVSDTKTEVNDRSNGSNRKASELGETTKHSDPMGAPRPRSFFQHDDRGTAGQDGRRSGRRVTAERGWWKDSKDDEERAARKAPSSDLREKEGKSQARSGNHDNHHVWRHDRFPEVEGDTNPPAKKRRPFREEKEKLPVESEPTENTAHEPRKGPHPISSTGGSDRGRDRRPLERRDHDRGYQRERSFSNRGQVEKAAFPSRERFGGGDNGGRYRGRDNRFGERQGYRSDRKSVV